jgi:hypothetical protein
MGWLTLPEEFNCHHVINYYGGLMTQQEWFARRNCALASESGNVLRTLAGACHE